MVNEQTILKELHELRQEQWTEVLDFIHSLRTIKEAAPPEKRPMTAAALLQSGLVGLWADRTDIQDSQSFARQLREKAQTRSREP